MAHEVHAPSPTHSPRSVPPVPPPDPALPALVGPSVVVDVGIEVVAGSSVVDVPEPLVVESVVDAVPGPEVDVELPSVPDEVLASVVAADSVADPNELRESEESSLAHADIERELTKTAARTCMGRSYATRSYATMCDRLSITLPIPTLFGAGARTGARSELRHRIASSPGTHRSPWA